MSGADEPDRTPKTLWTFGSRADIEQFATGCDADVGGTSSVHLDLDAATGTGRFWGEMRLGVRAGLEKQVRGGYAGLRSKVRRRLAACVRACVCG